MSDGQIQVAGHRRLLARLRSLHDQPGAGPGDAAKFHFGSTVSAVQIWNESPFEMVVNNIGVTYPEFSTTPPTNALVQIQDSPNSTFTYSVDQAAQAGATVRILSTGKGAVDLAGAIDDPDGVTTVTSTASILATGTAQSIETGQLTLDSLDGDIGSLQQPLAATLYQTSLETPQFAATAPQGKVYLQLATVDQIASALMVTGTSLTGAVGQPPVGDAGLSQASGSSSTTSVPSTYNLDGVSASQQLDVSATTSTAVKITITSPDDLEIGQVVLAAGDVTLDSTGGSIVDAATGGVTNVEADNISLDSADSIGAANDFLRIDAAYGGSGDVTASAPVGIWLNQVSGDLSAASITATSGTVDLEAGGAILGAADAEATVLTAENAVLSASAGIGKVTSRSRSRSQQPPPPPPAAASSTSTTPISRRPARDRRHRPIRDGEYRTRPGRRIASRRRR